MSKTLLEARLNAARSRDVWPQGLYGNVNPLRQHVFREMYQEIVATLGGHPAWLRRYEVGIDHPEIVQRLRQISRDSREGDLVQELTLEVERQYIGPIYIVAVTDLTKGVVETSDHNKLFVLCVRLHDMCDRKELIMSDDLAARVSRMNSITFTVNPPWVMIPS